MLSGIKGSSFFRFSGSLMRCLIVHGYLFGFPYCAAESAVSLHYEPSVWLLMAVLRPFDFVVSPFGICLYPLCCRLL
jgi:hypothetical protein